MSTAETPKRRGRPPKVKEAPAPTPPPQGEMVVPIPLTELHPFPNHPFKVRDDEAMKETTESVKEYGVLTPAIVRPREEGGYEIVAGHRRKRACELAGLTALPALVRNLDDDTATILMVDSNIQRENILPSERAQAYKMKLETIKRRGARTDLTSPNNSAKLRSDDEIGAAMGMSGDTVRNYISLTQLVPELQQMVDDKKIAVTPAYQIAALKPEEQALLVETMESEQATPSVSQAQRMKKLLVLVDIIHLMHPKYHASNVPACSACVPIDFINGVPEFLQPLFCEPEAAGLVEVHRHRQAVLEGFHQPAVCSWFAHIIQPLQKSNALICTIKEQLEPEQGLYFVWDIFEGSGNGIAEPRPIKERPEPLQVFPA